MGDYTELVFAAKLPECTTCEELEELEQWVLVKLKKGSWYFPITTPMNKLSYNQTEREWTVSIRCSLKDESLIHEFLAFIKPLVKYGAGENDFLGYYIHEQAKEPTLIYL